LAANQGHSKAQAILNKLFAKKQAIANNQTAESQNQNSEVQNAVENKSAESPVEQPDFMTISEIIAKEQRALQAIEKELNIKLEKLDKLNIFSRGYVLNEKGQVTGLSCYEYEIKDLNRIIEPLKDLSNLRELYLRDNQISELSGLKDLRNLEKLSLGSNQIRELSGLKDLSNLSELVLWNNEISELSGLKGLRNLQKLYLDYNHIEELPEWITDFDMDIHWNGYGRRGIVLYNNPLKKPPVEIVKQGKEAIRQYFEAQTGSGV